MRKLVRSLTTARLKKLDREVRKVAHKPEDADAIHDLRVSVRRLQQELRVFKAWFDPDDLKSIRNRLRKLMDRCAAVRNCDVAVEVLKSAGVTNAVLTAGLGKERQRTQKELNHAIETWNKKERIQEWRHRLRVAHGKSKETVEQNARSLLPKMADDLFRAGEGAARPESTYPTMHRLRLKAKRVRYTLEIFEQVYGSGMEKIAELLRGLQENLGLINDCATTLEMIRRNRGAAAAVQRLAGEREAQFRAYWKTHFGPQEKARWKAVLGAADRKK